ncbi:polysaccharide biosynthesis tyrosine autokinase [Stenotrophomonas sp. SY1]|uniref:polysaccharide biosynthesis tyrosine autokinase n=1 Tax=Stenotrophomonas sp. SY1 TaxID=477235 RepID=UPI001E4C8E31|nr:polysaccharide biosynthesis tyrosine autokinase [Stenotrophomonas sp. SY1]MCD9086645.1 polysaccharide biosynthesis tyrosine autokinase [Stenotrophomonas sp. SY1]
MTTTASATINGNKDGIGLRELLGAIIDDRWRVLIITLAFVGASLLYVALATPVYRAEAVVQVETKVPALPGLAEVSGALGLGPRSTEATTEIALITSRKVVGSAVDALRLDIEVVPDYLPVAGRFIARRAELPGSAGLGRVRFGLARFGWGGEWLRVRTLEVPERLLGKRLVLVARGHGRYALHDDSGSVLLEGVAGQVARRDDFVLDVTNLRAHSGMRFGLRLQPRLSVVNEVRGAVGVSEAGKGSGILKLSYQDPDPARAAQVLQQLMNAYVEQNVERSAAEASTRLHFVRAQMPSIRDQLDRAQRALSDYQTRVDSVDMVLQTKGLLEQQVAVETGIQQLRLQQAEIDRRFTRDHPAYQALMRQLGELETRKNAFQGRVRQLPESQQELLRLTRDLQVSNEMYTAMLHQAQQLDVARAGTIGNVRIVDAAEVDGLDPVAPRRALLVLAGLACGLFSSVGWILLSKLFNRGVEDPSQLEEMGLPVYAAVPTDSPPGRRLLQVRRRAGDEGLLAVLDPAALAVEALRSLRTSLHFAKLEARNNIVLISGASPGAGKTFVTTNLAAVLAQAGQRVLLIDADMRKGTVHKVLGVSQAPGLSDVLAGHCGVADAITQYPALNGLHFIARGTAPPNPSELLLREALEQLLDAVQGMFDVVLIDTPPILAVTDASVIARHAGTSLLVARFGKNQPRELEVARRRFEQNGVKLRGVILNAVEQRVMGFSSYGYYEYR